MMIIVRTDEERFHQYSLMHNEQSSSLGRGSGVQESCSTSVCSSSAQEVKSPFIMVPIYMVGRPTLNREAEVKPALMRSLHDSPRRSLLETTH